MFHDPLPSKARLREATILFKTRDGAELVGQLYEPASRSRPFAVVILNPATGVPQGYYAHFAKWLVEEKGLACLTYDYRGIGRSIDGPTRKNPAKMSDWGITDAEAARAKMRFTFPGVPIWHIGHSLGGMMLPFQNDFKGVSRVITIASGAPLHRDHPWPYRAQAYMFWFVLGPLLTLTHGYLPSRYLGLGEDLPSRAFWQWRKWCTQKQFYMPEVRKSLPAFTPEQLNMPVKLVTFSDDDLCPKLSTTKLRGLYGTGEIDEIDPRPNGGSLGHMGIFQRKNGSYWERLIA